jgi:hypothetical protein
MQSSPALHSVADGGPVLEYLPRQQCVCDTVAVRAVLFPEED